MNQALIQNLHFLTTLPAVDRLLAVLTNSVHEDMTNHMSARQDLNFNLNIHQFIQCSPSVWCQIGMSKYLTKDKWSYPLISSVEYQCLVWNIFTIIITKEDNENTSVPQRRGRHSHPVRQRSFLRVKMNRLLKCRQTVQCRIVHTWHFSGWRWTGWGVMPLIIR